MDNLKNRIILLSALVILLVLITANLYRSNKLLKSKLTEEKVLIERIESEKLQLMKTIDLLKSDESYQLSSILEDTRKKLDEKEKELTSCEDYSLSWLKTKTTEIKVIIDNLNERVGHLSTKNISPHQ